MTEKMTETEIKTQVEKALISRVKTICRVALKVRSEDREKERKVVTDPFAARIMEEVWAHQDTLVRMVSETGEDRWSS